MYSTISIKYQIYWAFLVKKTIIVLTAGQLIEIAITGLAIRNTSKTSIKKFSISFINCPADNNIIMNTIQL